MEKGLYAIVPVSLDDVAKVIDAPVAAKPRAKRIAALATTGWPTPATVAQGWLSNRWNRRDGNVYGNVSARASTGPNSPIAGGEDTHAAVDVPSGAPVVATP